MRIFSFSFHGLPLCFFIRRQHKWHIFFPLIGDLGHSMASLAALEIVLLFLYSFQLEGFPFLQYNFYCLSWNAFLLLHSFEMVWPKMNSEELLLSPLEKTPQLFSAFIYLSGYGLFCHCILYQFLAVFLKIVVERDIKFLN